MVWHPRCRQAAPGLLQTTMQISGQPWAKCKMIVLAWTDCDGNTTMMLFGREDVCECAWCDCFFQCCMFCGWGGHRRWPVAHPDSNFCFTRLWDLRTLVFVEMCFLSWHVTPMSGNRISIHGTNRKHEQYLRVRSGEVVFYAIVHVVINTTSTLCSFVCTKLICYVHNSCA